MIEDPDPQFARRAVRQLRLSIDESAFAQCRRSLKRISAYRYRHASSEEHTLVIRYSSERDLVLADIALGEFYAGDF